MQTPEDRIRLQYKALKKEWNWSYSNIGELFMRLARQWKKPIREIKCICNYKQGGNARA